ncbi:MAG: polysaccharide deacetylase family protein [Candidatus Cloacimonetes bacterium]|nr:polysaccharide deacetylase family protein [Candidatus Cloacimonadota bacterium]
MLLYILSGLVLVCVIEYLTLGSIYYFIEIVFFRRKSKVIALTFDDGPDPVFSREILKLLKQYKVKATFFVCGKQSQKYPEVISQMVREGHEIGNHSVNHRQMIFKKPSTIYAEIMQTDEILKKLGVQDKLYFRPPFGRYLLITPLLLAKLKKKMIMWNIPSKDYKAKSADEIIRRVLKNAKKGGIIVMHDGRADRSKSVKALAQIIPELLAKGFTFQTIDEYIN